MRTEKHCNLQVFHSADIELFGLLMHWSMGKAAWHTYLRQQPFLKFLWTSMDSAETPLHLNWFRARMRLRLKASCRSLRLLVWNNLSAAETQHSARFNMCSILRNRAPSVISKTVANAPVKSSSGVSDRQEIVGGLVMTCREEGRLGVDAGPVLYNNWINWELN